jgi:hypothetical protein
MQSGVDVSAGAGAGEDILDVDEDNIPSAGTSATSLVTPRTERLGRRRVSGIHISRTLVRYIYLPLSTPIKRTARIEQRSTDFSITRLGHTWVQHPMPCAESHGMITSHLPFILCHPAAPPPIRLQVALALGDILTIVTRHLATAPSDLQATVQRRVLAVLAQLGGLGLSASMELRRLGLETLH